MTIRSLAVFCGSKQGSDPLFSEHAAELGALMASHHVAMIYGGGSSGLMGSVADAMMKGNGRVTGIIPHILVEWEHQHQGITELVVADDMHERKKKMYQLCDAAIILPGGFGTLDELFEFLTWNQLSIHDKPVFLLNSGGFYDYLLAHINRLIETNFLYETAGERLIILDQPKALLPFL